MPHFKLYSDQILIEITQIRNPDFRITITQLKHMASQSLARDKFTRGGRHSNKARCSKDSETHQAHKNIYIERDIPTFDWEESGQASHSRKPPKHRRSPHVPSAEAPTHRKCFGSSIRDTLTNASGPGLREIVSAHEAKNISNVGEIKVGVSQVCSALRAWSSLSGLPSISVPSALASRVEGNLRRAAEDMGGARARPVSSHDVMPSGIPLHEVFTPKRITPKVAYPDPHPPRRCSLGSRAPCSAATSPLSLRFAASTPLCCAFFLARPSPFFPFLVSGSRLTGCASGADPRHFRGAAGAHGGPAAVPAAAAPRRRRQAHPRLPPAVARANTRLHSAHPHPAVS